MNEIMSGNNTDPTDNLKKKPKKSILKSSSSFEVSDGPAGSKRKNSCGPAHKETKWDENNILETLHPPNKDYGHMKIEEPKTPYERDLPMEVDGVNPEELAKRLKETSARNTDEEDDEEDLSPEKLAKKKQFESKRKQHYNEFLKAKEALKNLKEDDDEE